MTLSVESRWVVSSNKVKQRGITKRMESLSEKAAREQADVRVASVLPEQGSLWLRWSDNGDCTLFWRLRANPDEEYFEASSHHLISTPTNGVHDAYGDPTDVLVFYLDYIQDAISLDKLPKVWEYTLLCVVLGETGVDDGCMLLIVDHLESTIRPIAYSQRDRAALDSHVVHYQYLTIPNNKGFTHPPRLQSDLSNVFVSTPSLAAFNTTAKQMNSKWKLLIRT